MESMVTVSCRTSCASCSRTIISAWRRSSVCKQSTTTENAGEILLSVCYCYHCDKTLFKMPAQSTALLNLFKAQSSPESYWWGLRSQNVAERERQYLTLQYHQPEWFCVKMGMDESRLNVSLIVSGKVKRQCQQIKYSKGLKLFKADEKFWRERERMRVCVCMCEPKRVKVTNCIRTSLQYTLSLKTSLFPTQGKLQVTFHDYKSKQWQQRAMPTDSKDTKDASKFTNLFHVMCEFGDSSDQCYSVSRKGLAVLDIRSWASAGLVLKIGNFCLQSIQYLRTKLKLNNKCKFTAYITLVS